MEVLPKGTTAGVTRRVPDHYSQVLAKPEEPTAGVAIAALAGKESTGPGGAGKSIHRRRGNRRHYRRKIEGITGEAITGITNGGNGWCGLRE